MTSKLPNAAREKLRAVWRKALVENGLRIPCADKKTAMRLRFALYTSVRGVRTGKEPADEGLVKALEGLTIRLEEGALIFTPASELDYMRAIEGLAQEAPETDALRIAESEARVREMLKDLDNTPRPIEPATSTNRFYKREGGQ